MKRFLRYLLLIVSVILIVVNVSSYYVSFQFQIGQFAIADWNGLCILRHNSLPDKLIDFRDVPNPNDLVTFTNATSTELIPGSLWFVSERTGKYRSIGCVMLIPLLPLLAVTTAIWYRPFKSWLHGTHRKGFEVEMKKNESP